MVLTEDTLFSRNFLWLKLASAAYVVALILAHVKMPWAVWPVAVFFSIAMNLTYPWAAMVQGVAKGTEISISAGLIMLSLIGLFFPLMVIAAIFLHGCWDLLKHRGGRGAPFFGWYLGGCVTVDWIYAASLFWYWSAL